MFDGLGLDLLSIDHELLGVEQLSPERTTRLGLTTHKVFDVFASETRVVHPRGCVQSIDATVLKHLVVVPGDALHDLADGHDLIVGAFAQEVS